MILNNFKYIAADEIDDEFWEALDTYTYNDMIQVTENDNNLNSKGMKDIFFDKKIKTITKITEEHKKVLTFGNISSLMNIKDGTEAHVGAYAELEFFAYRYSKVHGKYPDLIKLRKVRSEKFLEKFLTNLNIPEYSYHKSFEYQDDKLVLNSIIFAITDTFDKTLYLFIDPDEAYILYDKTHEKENIVLHTLIGLIKGVVEPKVTKNKIYVVYQSQSGFEKTGFNIKKVNVDLDANYNDGFGEVSTEIIKGLNDKDKSNLVMLSGEPGTGKCVIGDTKITIRHKKTGKVEEINIEDLM